jgi:hypothetical protein
MLELIRKSYYFFAKSRVHDISKIPCGYWRAYRIIVFQKSTESQEVKCAARGDSYYAFAIKREEKGKDSQDWDTLAYKQRELYTTDINYGKKTGRRGEKIFGSQREVSRSSVSTEHSKVRGNKL